jgi:hypothetical protein
MEGEGHTNSLLAFEFPPDPDRNTAIDAHIGRIVQTLEASGLRINPLIADYFCSSALYNSLPQEIRESDEALGQYIEHTSRFADLIYSERDKRWKGDTTGLFGEEVTIPESSHMDGRTRRSEKGLKINVPYLSTVGVDPSKVLFFRITQPADVPKPEFYWTSDYRETRGGLTREISREQRQTAVILIAPLDTLENSGGGLIQDINDDRGVPVRTISLEPFDQAQCLGKIPVRKSQ